jgi:DNA-binding phage protein
MNVNTDDADDFPSRMNVALEQAGGVAALSRKSGLSDGVIQKYRKGDSDPSRSRLVAISRASGLAVQWLATGEGPMRQGAVTPGLLPVQGVGWDATLMRECIREVEELLSEMEMEMEPAVKADFTMDLYARELEKRQRGQHLSAPEKIRLLKQAG